MYTTRVITLTLHDVVRTVFKIRDTVNFRLDFDYIWQFVKQCLPPWDVHVYHNEYQKRLWRKFLNDEVSTGRLALLCSKIDGRMREVCEISTV
jgi:hypothetical protein